MRRAHRPRPDTVDLTSLGVTAVHRWAATGKRAAPMAIPTSGALANATPAAVAQVLDVLIDNAFRHGRGAVTVRTRTTPGGAAIEVSDEGTVPTDDLTRLAADRDGEHGIGLRLAHTLIEADGGRLSIVNQDPSTFRILYPVSGQDPPPDRPGDIA